MPLNARGLEQAHELAGRLAEHPLAAVYSSDLVRAHDTARIVADAQGLEVVLDPDLREKHFGSWEGLTDTEIQARYPDAVRGRWGDGETTEEVALRVIAAMDRIRARQLAAPVLVVSHGGPIRAILGHLEIEHGAIGNCELIRFEY